jgi:YesN/AraC family two-component response regulator
VQQLTLDDLDDELLRNTLIHVSQTFAEETDESFTRALKRVYKDTSAREREQDSSVLDESYLTVTSADDPSLATNSSIKEFGVTVPSI